MSNPETTAVDWNDIWRSLQELGASLAPLVEGPVDTPQWVVNLTVAMADAEEVVQEMCEAENG